MGRIDKLQKPRQKLRQKLPEPLANALRLYGYNWRGQRSRDGKLWKIYPYGKPGAPRGPRTWTLHSDADPQWVVQWLIQREPGRIPLQDRFLLKNQGH